MKAWLFILWFGFMSLFSSCYSGDDYDPYMTSYYYSQAISIAEINGVIQEIRYPQANLIEYPNKKSVKLRLSYHEPTTVVVKSKDFEYTLKIGMRFVYGEYDNAYPISDDYSKSYKGLEIKESNATQSWVEKVSTEDNSSYYNRRVYVVDSVYIR